MDVDLLKPGTVPISPDTFLGFEFLLDKHLLLNHLQKQNPDPTPIDLIRKFYDVINMETRSRMETTETRDSDRVRNHSKKIVAMKILAIKVLAYLDWNLAQIILLPVKTQVSLFRDLMFFTNDKKVKQWNVLEKEDIRTTSGPRLFAFLIFHRLVLYKLLSTSQQHKYGTNDMHDVEDKTFCNLHQSIAFLEDALEWQEAPPMLSFECFEIPTEESAEPEFNWNNAKIIPKEEFRSQICYDLGTFLFFLENYESAWQNFSKCKQISDAVQTSHGFATFDKATLNVYIKACDRSGDMKGKSLLEQLNNSVVNQYMGITNILQRDNVEKQIPLIHRINLELDMQGAISSGAFTVARDLLCKVKALNHVRSILDRMFLNEFSLAVPRHVDALLWAIQVNWQSHRQEDAKVIKDYLLELLIKEEGADLMVKIKANEVLSNIFTKNELSYLNKGTKVPEVPESLFASSEFSLFSSTKKRKPKMELKQLSKQLINSYDCKEIKELVAKIAAINLGKSIMEINPDWELPIPLQSAIKGLSKGVLHDFSYVLLAKSKEQLQNKNWNLSLELLITLEKELQAAPANTAKLSKMISWEVLLVQITQLMEEWPKSSVDTSALANACEACLQTNDSVLPRTEVIESCAVCLLNLGRWEFVINYEKRWTSFEIMSAIALACHEVVKNKGGKKFSKNLWDIVLPVFAPNVSQSKRGSSNYLDASNLKNTVLAIFTRLKDSWCSTVVISMLTKLYNIFRDEPNFELQVDYSALWPTTVSNANSYNANGTLEMLLIVLDRALKEYPTNVPWLRLMGDINYANGNYKMSLSFYLKSLIIFNDYFNIPVRYDDHVFRRMIKCCQALGCYTQAAVLCQFLEDPDYSQAFRILSDQKTCNDAVDAYYHCFWDTNILEFLIHIHNRRGEFQRRKCAVQVMGMLELNSNNNEEIQREASNLRKSVFLRALCKQYVF